VSPVHKARWFAGLVEFSDQYKPHLVKRLLLESDGNREAMQIRLSAPSFFNHFVRMVRHLRQQDACANGLDEGFQGEVYLDNGDGECKTVAQVNAIFTDEGDGKATLYGKWIDDHGDISWKADLVELAADPSA